MKRFTALLLLVLLAIAPFSASFAGSVYPSSVTIWGMELNSSNPYYVNGANGGKGTYGSASNWNARYENGVLTLRGLNVDNCDTEKGISASGGAGVTLTIKLEGDNRVSMTAGNAIFVNCSLMIDGTGTLTATAGASANSGSSFGILALEDITMNGGSVTGKGGTSKNASSIGVYASNNLSVSGGTLTGEGGHATANYGDSCGVTAHNDIEAGQYGTIKGKGGTSEQYSSLGVETEWGDIIVQSFGSITGEGGESKSTIAGQSYGVNAGGAITVKSNGYLQGKAQTAPNGSYGIVTTRDLTLDQDATTLAQGHRQALYPNANLSGGTAVASEKYGGSNPVTYDSTKNDTYQYFRMPEAVQATQITVTQDTFPFGQAPENETITVTSNAATFNFNASNSFGSATMDGKRLDLGNVGNPGGDGSVSNGSIVIHLNKAYLDTLPAGTHILVVNLAGVYAGQTVRTTITVLPSGGGTGAGGDVGPDVPKTGDAATPMLWLGLMLLAGAGLAVSAVRRRKRQNG